MNRLRPWLELLRLPAVFTAMADIFAGYLFHHEGLAPTRTFVALLAASSLIYLGGMVLNDVCDEAQDRRERPNRPIPSGRVTRASARRLAASLLGAGLVVSLLVSSTTAAIAAALVACVVLYDAVLKSTVLGPVVMGLCRGLNLLLGMSTATASFTDGPSLYVAGAMFAYIVGVTWFGRHEAGRSKPLHLALASSLMDVAAFSLAGLLYWPERVGGNTYYLLLLFLLAGWLGGATFPAVQHPEPAYVQRGVRTALLGIILFDAAIVCAARGAPWALVVLTLLIPARLLGRWLSAT